MAEIDRVNIFAELSERLSSHSLTLLTVMLSRN